MTQKEGEMTCGRILVVDNDEDSRRLTCQILEREGYCVCEASSGERALDKIGPTQPDLVILSPFTREIRSISVVRRIRADIDASALPILMYTPITSEAKLEALEAGVNDFLTRPFHQTELIARTRALIAFRESHREVIELKRTLTERTNQEWQAIFNAINDPVVITDAEGTITSANHAAGLLFNMATEKLAGTRCASILEGNTLCPHYSLSELVTSAEVECQSRRTDLRLLVRVQRISDAAGKPISFAHVFQRSTSQIRTIISDASAWTTRRTGLQSRTTTILKVSKNENSDSNRRFEGSYSRGAYGKSPSSQE